MQIVIPVKPTPKGRPRFGRNNAIFTDKKTADAEKIIALHLRHHFHRPLEGALALRIDFMMIRPKSSKRTLPDVRPDLDNLAKLVMDAANGIVWEDDCQVVDLALTKRYGHADQITLTVLTVA